MTTPHDHDTGADDPRTFTAAELAELDQAAAAAAHQADWLVGRTRARVTSGEDLRRPDRLRDLAITEVRQAVLAAKPPRSSCLCGLANGRAAQTLIAELARRLAVAEAGR